MLNNFVQSTECSLIHCEKLLFTAEIALIFKSAKISQHSGSFTEVFHLLSKGLAVFVCGRCSQCGKDKTAAFNYMANAEIQQVCLNRIPRSRVWSPQGRELYLWLHLKEVFTLTQ